MKKVSLFLPLLVSMIMMHSCSTQKITSTWVDRDKFPEQPYESICVIALVPDRSSKIEIEERMVELIKERGGAAISATEIFGPVQSAGLITREQFKEKLTAAGCDAVLTISELDVRTEERYVPGAEPRPLPPYHYRYYNSYYSYYTYRYNQVYVPGYVVSETTYFFETNFYDLESEDILWSIQSSAFEPSDVISWFYEYSKLIVKELKKQEIIED